MDKQISENSAKIMGHVSNASYSVNMNTIVGTHDILFVCLDTLRYDVAFEEQEKNNTPNLNRYGKWEKRHAPGNFTLPSHMAMFSGFLPTPAQPTPKLEMEKLFIPKEMSVNRPTPKEAFLFEGASFVEGLEKEGYETICVGGVNFFNKRTELGRILPGLFKHSYWHPSFSCHIKNSFENQLSFIERKLGKFDEDKRIFLYLNIDSIHYPNYFYIDGAKEDSKATHAAALHYVDSRIERLFRLFRQRGKTFVIVCSDHGSCYGEDGYYFHRVSHEMVYTVPYKHFILQEDESVLDPYKRYMYSYPHKTAYQYTQQLRLEQYQHELAKSATTLYFHIPFCESKCGYCNLFSIPCKNPEYMNRYIEAVKRHDQNYRNVLNFENVRFESLIFGGGTPLILSIGQLEELFNIAEKSFGINLEKVSICIETSPNQTSREKLMYLKSKKVNRVSIGVQSFVQTELDRLKRLHSAKRAQMALEDIQKVGFDSLNIDLIYGIASQTMESLKYSLETALTYQPDEIFAYPLYQRPNTGIYKRFETDRVLQYRMYFMICEFLAGKGYFQTSMRRFVKDKPSKELSCGFENMISLGCGGRSYIGNLHFCERYTSRQVRCRNILNAYINRQTFFDGVYYYELDKNEMKRRFILKNLFYCSGIAISDYNTFFGTDLYGDFPVLLNFIQENWATESEGRVKLTPLGLSLSDYIGTMLISDTVARRMECFYDA